MPLTSSSSRHHKYRWVVVSTNGHLYPLGGVLWHLSYTIEAINEVFGAGSVDKHKAHRDIKKTGVFLAVLTLPELFNEEAGKRVVVIVTQFEPPVLQPKPSTHI